MVILWDGFGGAAADTVVADSVPHVTVQLLLLLLFSFINIHSR